MAEQAEDAVCSSRKVAVVVVVACCRVVVVFLLLLAVVIVLAVIALVADTFCMTVPARTVREVVLLLFLCAWCLGLELRLDLKTARHKLEMIGKSASFGLAGVAATSPDPVRARGNSCRPGFIPTHTL